ncbi:hypothetical protein QR98_0084310 [Sarcoptes scabiei]|uniref:Uncharacterized protein n=1 Tax=Sarcoptes scabiei TaxID=52283 RepID=A0A132AH51_SARSC|nr:hypothetical protein QR98_0084310 [Sarcoptes scabiei]
MDCCLVLYHPYRPLLQFLQDWTSKESILSTAWNVKDHKHWFAELNTDLDKVLEISKFLLNLYEMWNNFDEKKEISELLLKMPKPKTQPSRPPSQGTNENPNA